MHTYELTGNTMKSFFFDFLIKYKEILVFFTKQGFMRKKHVKVAC